MRRYAEKTSVPVDRSEQEIKRLLRDRGATRIGTMSEPGRVTVYFDVKGRQAQVTIPMPKVAPPEASRTTRGVREADAEERRRWRVLVLWLKGLFETVDSGIMTFDQAFLAHIVIPGHGQTLGQVLVPKLDALYDGATLRALLEENPA